jgi:hypothetical protein
MKIRFDETLKGEPLPGLTAMVLRLTEGGMASPMMALCLLLASASASWHFYECTQDEKNNSKEAQLSFAVGLSLLLILAALIVLSLYLPMIPISPTKL